MKSLITLLCVLFPFASTFAVTADELAVFLGVSKWETSVAMPPGTFSASIFAVKDGQVLNSGLTLSPGEIFEKGEKTKLLVMGQMNPDKQRFTVLSTSMGGTSNFSISMGETKTFVLPSEIGEGIYPLGGELNGKEPGAGLGKSKIELLRWGFVLQIAKLNPEN